MSDTPSSTKRGFAAGVVAFTLWGLLPGYWKAVHWLSAGQIICLRALLSAPVLVLVLLLRRELAGVLRSMLKPRIAGLHLLTAALLAGNWMVFVWATHHERIVEASLGYFLTPLANVGMGALFLGEKLRRGQWIAVALAAAGVAMQMLAVGGMPWVALSLCGTFAFYGLLRKQAPLDSLAGLTVESLLATPVAAVILWLYPPVRIAETPVEWSLVLLMGVITAIPLLGFATAARLLPLSVVGLLQFIAPSLQFLVGALVYGEPVTALRMVSFALIWCGLVVFTLDARRRAAVARGAPRDSKSDADQA